MAPKKGETPQALAFHREYAERMTHPPYSEATSPFLLHKCCINGTPKIEVTAATIKQWWVKYRTVQLVVNVWKSRGDQHICHPLYPRIGRSLSPPPSRYPNVDTPLPTSRISWAPYLYFLSELFLAEYSTPPTFHTSTVFHELYISFWSRVRARLRFCIPFF